MGGDGNGENGAAQTLGGAGGGWLGSGGGRFRGVNEVGRLEDERTTLILR